MPAPIALASVLDGLKPDSNDNVRTFLVFPSSGLDMDTTVEDFLSKTPNLQMSKDTGDVNSQFSNGSPWGQWGAHRNFDLGDCNSHQVYHIHVYSTETHDIVFEVDCAKNDEYGHNGLPDYTGDDLTENSDQLFTVTNNNTSGLEENLEGLRPDLRFGTGFVVPSSGLDMDTTVDEFLSRTPDFQMSNDTGDLYSQYSNGSPWGPWGEHRNFDLGDYNSHEVYHVYVYTTVDHDIVFSVVCAKNDEYGHNGLPDYTGDTLTENSDQVFTVTNTN